MTATATPPRGQVVDLDQLSADDLAHLAAIRRAHEQEAENRRLERLAKIIDRPALGWHHRQHDPRPPAAQPPVRLDDTTSPTLAKAARRVAAQMVAAGWPPDLTARGVLQHIPAGADRDQIKTAIAAGIRAAARRNTAA